jgi:flagellar biosynthesis/type III secretory pathway protein FliH
MPVSPTRRLYLDAFLPMLDADQQIAFRRIERLAFEAGYDLGYEHGRRDAIEAGYAAGYEDGHEDGERSALGSSLTRLSGCDASA